MSDKEKRRAADEIAALVQEAMDALHKAEKLAKKHGLDFHFGPAYGMGGTFYGEGVPEWYDYSLDKGAGLGRQLPQLLAHTAAWRPVRDTGQP